MSERDEIRAEFLLLETQVEVAAGKEALNFTDLFELNVSLWECINAVDADTPDDEGHTEEEAELLKNLARTLGGALASFPKEQDDYEYADSPKRSLSVHVFPPKEKG